MIQLENISKWYGEILLYENLSLTIAEGHRIALIAKNGAGKTTLLNIVAGVESADNGNVTFQNGITVGYLAQEPVLADNLTVLEAIYHADDALVSVVRDYEKALAENDNIRLGELISQMDALNAWDFEHRAKNILTRLKITDFFQKVATLSGGQRKRLALAMVLIESPDVLILDEPTNHLDLEMAQWLEDYLLKSGKTLFMVTHDRYFLDRVCTDIYELDHGILYTYKGGYSDYVEKRAERIEQFNTEVEKAQNLFRRELEWMRRMPQARGHKAKYRKDAFYETKEKAFRKRNDDVIDIQIKASRLGTKIFEADHLNKRFGDKIILNDFSYRFARYEKLGIVGKNGTGKSTFLNIISGDMQPDSGIVEIGESVRFGYYRQTGMSFDENKKVIDAVREIAEVVTLGDGKTITASQFLNHFLFPPEVQYTYIYKLSGGEKRRLYLLTVLMMSPNFLILDEPTNDLDIMTLNILEDYLEKFGGCLIVVSHDRYFMDKVVDHLLVFEGNGKITVFPGNYTQYRNSVEEREEQERRIQEKPVLSKKSVSEKVERERKLTFKEKQEMMSLEQEIEVLEKEKKEMEKAMSSGTLSIDDLTSLSERYGILSADLDEKSMRWLELSEIKS
ncbi:MAG TPA: ABC-F family ATP-binding cassette domain-containing protein [Candidatus Avirikenella pullistercoris]|nr:ABC-F family ATP-binding cassette domain-containing protein [Candidatus Avirikenella pullistercoris]